MPRVYERKSPSKITIEGDTAKVHLVDGSVATIDASDAEMIGRYRWRANDGYALARDFDHGGRTVSIHRLIMRPGVGLHVDHIDGDRSNNTRRNLRVCTPDQNRHNRRWKNRTGATGVAFNCSKYEAAIRANGTYRRLGRFATLEEAAEAYRQAALEAYGEFAPKA